MTTAIAARAVVRVTRRLIATAATATLVGCQSHPVYRQPPDDSFTTSTEQMQDGGVVTAVPSAHVTRDFFKATGVQPLVGRLFLDGEYTGEATRAVVLSHDLWAAHFESSPNVIGRNIGLDGHAAVVVGILPTGFNIPEGTQLWIPK